MGGYLKKVVNGWEHGFSYAPHFELSPVHKQFWRVVAISSRFGWCPLTSVVGKWHSRVMAAHLKNNTIGAACACEQCGLESILVAATLGGPTCGEGIGLA